MPLDLNSVNDNGREPNSPINDLRRVLERSRGVLEQNSEGIPQPPPLLSRQPSFIRIDDEYNIRHNSQMPINGSVNDNELERVSNIDPDDDELPPNNPSLISEEREHILSNYHLSNNELARVREAESLSSKVQTLKDLARNHGIEREWQNSQIWSTAIADGDSFEKFLDKLCGTHDAQRNPKKLLNTMMDILDKMETNTEFRDKCVGIAREHVTSCGDRTMLGLVHMQIAQKVYLDHTPNIRERFEIQQNMLKVEKVLELAHNKLESIGGNEEVETYLAYFYKLQEDLGIRIDGMLYEGVGGLTDEDVEMAKNELSSITEVDVLKKMADDPVIGTMYRSEFDEITASDPKFDLDSFLENESLDQYHERFRLAKEEINNRRAAFLKSELEKCS